MPRRFAISGRLARGGERTRRREGREGMRRRSNLHSLLRASSPLRVFAFSPVRITWASTSPAPVLRLKLGADAHPSVTAATARRRGRARRGFGRGAFTGDDGERAIPLPVAGVPGPPRPAPAAGRRAL